MGPAQGVWLDWGQQQSTSRHFDSDSHPWRASPSIQLKTRNGQIVISVSKMHVGRHTLLFRRIIFLRNAWKHRTSMVLMAPHSRPWGEAKKELHASLKPAPRTLWLSTAHVAAGPPEAPLLVVSHPAPKVSWPSHFQNPGYCVALGEAGSPTIQSFPKIIV